MATVTTKDRAMDMEIQQVPWWNRRTRMERRFFILSVTLLLATIGLSVALAGVLYKNMMENEPGYGLARVAAARSNNAENNFQTTAAFISSADENQVPIVFVDKQSDRGEVELGGGGANNRFAYQQHCMTPGCVKTANAIIQNMDQSVNPCIDFYKFACGGFVKRTVIPDDRTRMSSFSVLGDELLTQVTKVKFICHITLIRIT